MFRFVGLLWNAADHGPADVAKRTARLLKQSSTWQTALEGPGIAVFCAGVQSGAMCASTLENHSGVILGALYRRDAACDASNLLATDSLSDREQQQILGSQGKCLTRDFWGNYVAVLTDGVTRKWVIKDPTGSLPCLYTRHGGATVIFSCLQDCVALGITRLTTNWNYVRQRVATGGLFSDQNSIDEVRQVCRGQALAIDWRNSGVILTKALYWNPLSVSETDPLENPEIACDKLRTAVKATTSALLNDHKSILLRISGGLDSSIVLGCMRTKPACPRVVGYTYYNPRGSSDERRWARLAMAETTFEHVECPFDPLQVDLATMLQIGPTVEPAPALMYLTRKSAEAALASTYACTGVLSGEGGDSSFGSEAVTHAVDEYVKRHGISRGMLTLAARLAVFTDNSVWTILRSAIRQRLVGSSMGRYTERLLESTQLVTKEVRTTIAGQTRFPHPWFEQCRNIPWETINRLGALILPPEYYDPFRPPHDDNFEHLAPLYSQPVVEICLKIPTYVHFANGRDRGLARQAFAGYVPEPILRRQWKDRAPGFAHELAHKNLEFLREILLDGMLVKEGILDRQATEAVLCGELNKSAAVMPELFGALDVEIWARSMVAPFPDKWRREFTH